jgi:8-oxo-dGTP pyrophosphatase MutT (NUDIX family)
MPYKDLTADEIRTCLANPKPDVGVRDVNQFFFSEPAKPAAVLIPLTRDSFPEAHWHVVLTRRTQTVADHKGQVSFPGGRSDPEDLTPAGTALREAQEEIGLNPESVRVLGMLEPLYTISNYLVTPVIGEIPWATPFTTQPNEVERVFSIPLSWLADPEHFEIRQREVKFPTWPEPRILKVIYFDDYDSEILWGVSAEITLRLLRELDLL